MRAKNVNETTQDFTRGGNPYKKLKVGSYDPKVAVDTMVEILSEVFDVKVGFFDDEIVEIDISTPGHTTYDKRVMYFKDKNSWGILKVHHSGDLLAKTKDINKVLPLLINAIYGNASEIQEYIDDVERARRKAMEYAKTKTAMLNKMIDILK